MKIRMRPPSPPIPPVPPPKAPPTAFQLEMQPGELLKTAQHQQTRLKQLFGARKKLRDLDEETDSETHEHDHRSKQSPTDFLA